MTQLRRGLMLSVAVVLATAVACGTDSSDSSSPTTVNESDAPQSIVSLAPVATEMLFAVGAGDQVVAVDEQSNYPEEAPRTTLSGYTPNVEAVLGYDPDLVVTTEQSDDLISGLEAANVQVLVLPAAKSLDDVYSQIEQVGAATGHVGEAAELVSQMQTDIDAVVSQLPERDEPLTYFQELDETFYTVTNDTFVGSIYSMLGLTSIAEGSDPYPQLSAEYILDANPDIIFLADAQCCGVTAESVAQRPGWSELTAVQEGRVYVLDADIASRWGPRVVELVRQVGTISASIPVTVSNP
ncbi:MAG: ABC transporter substrate-binding protein [Rhodococcus sp.]|nr:ABC transporter substrate-binding protein [Rhodococcus sp. (in: high G+C Gram-positive bacteria)]